MRNFIVGVLTVAGCLFLIGCGDSGKVADVAEERLKAVPAGSVKSSLPEPSGGVVLSVDSMPITASEVIEPVRDRLAVLAKENDYYGFKTLSKNLLGQSLLQKITDIKLYKKAKAALPENINDEFIDNIVNQEVEKFIAQHGGNYAKAEETLKKMELSWGGFRKQQRRAMLVQSFVSEEVKEEKPITHSELLNYYEQIKSEYVSKDVIEFSLIDIEARRFVDTNTTMDAAVEKAAGQAEEIIDAIVAGGDFAEMAKLYSHGEFASDGGRWSAVRPGSLIAPYDSVEKAAMGMVVGQIKGPVIAGGHVFVIELHKIEKASTTAFADVQDEVEARLIMERRKRMVNEMIEKLVASVDMAYADEFLEYCTHQAYLKLK